MLIDRRQRRLLDRLAKRPLTAVEQTSFGLFRSVIKPTKHAFNWMEQLRIVRFRPYQRKPFRALALRSESFTARRDLSCLFVHFMT